MVGGVGAGEQVADVHALAADLDILMILQVIPCSRLIFERPPHGGKLDALGALDHLIKPDIVVPDLTERSDAIFVRPALVHPKLQCTKMNHELTELHAQSRPLST